MDAHSQFPTGPVLLFADTTDSTMSSNNPLDVLDMQLPMSISVRGITMKIEWFKRERVDDTREIIKEAAEAGDGFSMGEIEDLISLANMERDDMNMAVQVTREDNGELISVASIIPSPLCRSYEPVCGGGLTITKKKYRGKKGSKGKGLRTALAPIQIMMTAKYLGKETPDIYLVNVSASTDIQAYG